MTIQLLEKQMSLLEYISDERVNPRLDSKYILQFSELAVFLEKLKIMSSCFLRTFSINEREGKNCLYLLATTITAIDNHMAKFEN